MKLHSITYYAMTKKTKPFRDVLKRDLKLFFFSVTFEHVCFCLIGGAWHRVSEAFPFPLALNSPCGVQKGEPISAQQGGAGGTLNSTSNSALYKLLLFQRRETRAAHSKHFKEVSVSLASDYICLTGALLQVIYFVHLRSGQQVFGDRNRAQFSSFDAFIQPNLTARALGEDFNFIFQS